MRKLSLKALIIILLCFILPVWGFTPILALETPQSRSDTITKTDYKVVKVTLPIGRGGKNERLTSFRIIGSPDVTTVTRIDIDLAGTNQLSDLIGITIHYTGAQKRLHLEEAQLFGKEVRISNRKLAIAGNIRLQQGDNYFWVTADLSRNAREGNQIEASALNYTRTGGTVVQLPQAHGSRTILLNHQLLFSSGDYNSRNFRIPAIVTALDGSLITATDKRWNNPWDLPRHIDLVIRRSTDRGNSWSEPFTLAGENNNVGFGDATLICNQKNGEIICLFASGEGFLESSTQKPIRTYQSISQDDGVHWSTPVDITPQIYGLESKDSLTQAWQGAFVSSGNATQLRNGRIIAVLVVRETSSRAISNFALYSDDQGRTWQVSPNRIVYNGNEGKIVERSNGDLLASIRNRGYRIFNVSTDKGLSWGTPYYQTEISDPSCNGSLIKYTSRSEGWDVNRMLHSIPFSSERENLTVLLSYDEGNTWPIKKTIYDGKSAYSSLTILPDGTIGMYYEVGEYDIYQMYFARFSLNWLSDGKDDWTSRINYLNEVVDIKLESAPGLLIYPNPAVDQLHIQGSFSENGTVEVYNLSGVLMQSVPMRQFNGTLELELPGYKPGFYLLKIGSQASWFMVK